MRVFILSDIHVDFVENWQWIETVCSDGFIDDVLILAGDVTHNFDLLKQCLGNLRPKFRELFFVPGNHDLWMENDRWQHSLQKVEAIEEFCQQEGIQTRPKTFQAENLTIFPLFSWYSPPELPDSLFLPKPGEDPSNRFWNDNYFIRWPEDGFNPAEYFFRKNREMAPEVNGKTVITFSHFLPRQDVMFSENRQLDKERMKKYDRAPHFNFSRVAGSSLIEKQLRALKADIHVYGHQHINRDRVIDGVRYVSHCLGYPEERNRGAVKGIGQGLKCIWEATK